MTCSQPSPSGGPPTRSRPPTCAPPARPTPPRPQRPTNASCDRRSRATAPPPWPSGDRCWPRSPQVRSRTPSPRSWPSAWPPPPGPGSTPLPWSGRPPAPGHCRTTTPRPRCGGASRST
ncbi:hypothetical protein [Ornithinimicrobium kibberense]|uniref:hypothetical protein n=1 Tax=Ornithinimicrobium kibberense TaxID=282060 RepID=UPI003611FAD2